MNEVLSPVNHKTLSGNDKYSGKLDLIAQMLRNAIAPSVPENMKNTVMTMADSIDDIVASISGSGQKKHTEPKVKYFTLPRKDPAIWRKEALQKKINDLDLKFKTIERFDLTCAIAGDTGENESSERKKHSNWKKSNKAQIKTISSNLQKLVDKVNALDQIIDVSKLDQEINIIESDIPSIELCVNELLASWRTATN